MLASCDISVHLGDAIDHDGHRAVRRADISRGLYQTHHEVVALVTAPLRSHRGKEVAPASSICGDRPRSTPRRSWNRKTPTRPRPPGLAACRADLLVVCDYGQILAPATLDTAPLGRHQPPCLALAEVSRGGPDQLGHLSRRDANGRDGDPHDPETRRRTMRRPGPRSIGAEETAGGIGSRGWRRRGWLVRQVIDDLEAGRLEALPQDPALASKAPRLKKTDGLIDWNRPAAAIQESHPGDGALAEDVHLLASAGRPAGAADSRSRRRSRRS